VVRNFVSSLGSQGGASQERLVTPRISTARGKIRYTSIHHAALPVANIKRRVRCRNLVTPPGRTREQIPLSDAALKLAADWRARIKEIDPDALVFSTRSGKSISPNNVLRRQVFPACDALGLKHVTWLTLRRTYSSWAHEKGVPGKVVAQLMGHAKVDTALNVYTQVIDGALRTAVDKVGSELFTIVHKPETGVELTH
jgi:integrase